MAHLVPEGIRLLPDRPSRLLLALQIAPQLLRLALQAFVHLGVGVITAGARTMEGVGCLGGGRGGTLERKADNPVLKITQKKITGTTLNQPRKRDPL